jgi:diamine N-acetyltransferase
LVSLRAIDETNREAVEALRVTPAQELFVSGVGESLQEAIDEPDGRALHWAVYADDTPVGFVMISDDVGAPGYIAHYLWRLLIDARFQRRGYGTATLDLIADYFRTRGVEEMWTSAGQGDGSPIDFYERYGFERAGPIVFDDEVLLRLSL